MVWMVASIDSCGSLPSLAVVLFTVLGKFTVLFCVLHNNFRSSEYALYKMLFYGWYRY